MSRMETLLASADGQAKYLDWFGSDVTQVMVQDLRDKIRPRASAAEKPLSACAELGRLSGLQEAIDLFTRHIGAKQQGGAGLPQADYGAREITEE